MNKEIKFRAWGLHGEGLNEGLVLNNHAYTHMLATGLVDVNGKDVYEGDIIKTDTNQIGEIVWKSFGFHVEWLYDNYDSYLSDVRNCEVIGNIFDNPEFKVEVINE